MANKQYNIDFNPIHKINATLKYVTKSRYETDWHSIMHSHPFTELFYVLKGKGQFYIENKVFEVKEDDLIIVNANVRHTESSKDNEPLEYIVLGVDEISILADEEGAGCYYSLHNYNEYKQDVLFYLKTLLKEAEAKSKYYDLISKSLLDILIINIIRRTDTKLTVTDSKEFASNCNFVKTYIDEHFTEDICLEDLCQLSYMNKFYLVHAFKKYIGMTPIQYIITLRLSKACSMLKNTDHSIAHIASFIGMSSQSYFAQSFKKAYKMSPLTYRKISKAKKKKENEINEKMLK